MSDFDFSAQEEAIRAAAFAVEQPRLERLFDEVRMMCVGTGPLDYYSVMDSGMNEDGEYGVEPDGWCLHVCPGVCKFKGGTDDGAVVYQTFDVDLTAVLELLKPTTEPDDDFIRRQIIGAEFGISDSWAFVTGEWEGREISVYFHQKPTEDAEPMMVVNDKAEFYPIEDE